MSAVDEYESESGVGNLLGSSPFMQTCRGAALTDLTDVNMIRNKIRLSELFRLLFFFMVRSCHLAASVILGVFQVIHLFLLLP